MQKQWLLSYYDLGNIQTALATEIQSHKQGRVVAHHLKNLEELLEKVTAIMVATEHDYGENDEYGEISEQLLVSLIPKEYERWEEPYTVIPIGAGAKWGVVYKDTVSRPVGEKLYTQPTHAYRACRRLNAAYWENETHAETKAN